MPERAQASNVSQSLAATRRLRRIAYGGIAGRKVNGRVRLFMSINEITYHAQILEFEVPNVPPSKDVATAPGFVRTDQELSKIAIAKRSTIFRETLLENFFAMRYEQ